MNTQPEIERHYEEFPICCYTCNENLGIYEDTFNDMLNNGFTKEQALNDLGITDPCSRILMMNPVLVKFDMENRDLIEGISESRKQSPNILRRNKSSSSNEPIGEGLSLDIDENKEKPFEEPVYVGVPVINRNIKLQQEELKVGPENKVIVLNGRTYLAR